MISKQNFEENFVEEPIGCFLFFVLFGVSLTVFPFPSSTLLFGLSSITLVKFKILHITNTSEVVLERVCQVSRFNQFKKQKKEKESTSH